MKILFAALMCLVLGRAQCFAISGGPVYPVGLNITGTFAGVLIPKADLDSDPVSCSANSLGVFSIGVPDTGLSSGAFVMFAKGQVFTGTVQGVADPGKATLKGIFSATFDFTVRTNTIPPTETQVTASATGRLDTKITNSSPSFGTAGTRLNGEAALAISQGQVNPDFTPIFICPELKLTVIGFKQSNTVSTGT